MSICKDDGRGGGLFSQEYQKMSICEDDERGGGPFPKEHQN